MPAPQSVSTGFAPKVGISLRSAEGAKYVRAEGAEYLRSAEGAKYDSQGQARSASPLGKSVIIVKL